MKTRSLFLAATGVIVLAWPAGVSAVEIPGKVRSATNNTVTIATEGELAPNVGDPVHIYFKLPGVDAEISVGSGKVTAVNADSVEAKIDKATGKVSKVVPVVLIAPSSADMSGRASSELEGQ